LPSDIADMLNNLQPPCHASVAFGGKTLATLKESTMVSSHGSQDHFQANAKSFSSQVHAFVPSVEEEDHNQDDDDMGGGNSKGKSKDTKSSANIEAPAQAATQSTTPPAENKSTISSDGSGAGATNICRRRDSGSCAIKGLMAWSMAQAKIIDDTCACRSKRGRSIRFLL
jgi:hypothetical protein